MQEKIPHPAWIEIDLVQFKKNIAIVRQQIGSKLFCLPVKANAYGHGICQISKAAVEAGVDYLGVSCLAEGIQLRRAGIGIPILVLGAIHEDQIDDFSRYNLEFTISSRFKADLVAKAAQKKCRIHLEVDTGMQRTGVRCSTALQLIQYLREQPCFEVVGVYSHLASADHPDDPIAKKQLASFFELVQHPHFDGLICHIANSGGVLHFPTSHQMMVRPGLISFGYGALTSPCFSLKAKVSYFKVVEKGEGISYGHTYVTQKRTRIVTIPIGYGDGYRRALSNKGSVLIRGKKYPVVGAVCMDQFMVDVGDQEVYVGDEVVLIGKQGREEIALEEMANLCDTIPYEILCAWNDRIPRYY